MEWWRSVLMDNGSAKINVNWKNVIIGSAIGFILLFIFPTPVGSMIAILLATIYVGFAVGGNYKNGAFNGVITGIIIAIIQGVTVSYYFTMFIFSNLVFLILILGITYGIIGIVGGVIGIRIDKW
jgi:hypothetical protein